MQYEIKIKEIIFNPSTGSKKIGGLVRDLNPGPLAPQARIRPLDQRAAVITSKF